ncbi:DNA polymerase lambda [Polypterus senegalus]|uniref:DNA polymerase lambda n=1 Tax=Polypterus senegalus TaxID=55291 RepID=UPI0019656CA5|nr:DNA polymerase lambda [Polypterus senegalus]XP_039590760.1 DNA polymerase lambda [Polypterus senegalus]
MEPRGIVKAFPKVKRRIREPQKEELNKKLKPETPISGWLRGVRAYIIQAGIGSARTTIFQNQILQNGGSIENTFCSNVTHVIVDESMDPDRALRLLKIEKLPSSVQVLKSSWLSLCITHKRILDTAGYNLFTSDRYFDSNQPNNDTGCNSTTESNPDALKGNESKQMTETVCQKEPVENGTILQYQLSDNEASDDEDEVVNHSDLQALIIGHSPLKESDSSITVPSVVGKWVCAQSSESKKENYNKHITDKLEVLEKSYSHQGDKWRALGYAKAINALKSYSKSVTSYEEASQIQGIGKKIAEKIREILESGHLRKLDHISDSVQVLELFSNIWGAGAKTAQMWYQQGFRTLGDIRMKASLTSQQTIGLKHYNDFLDRMTREEAGEIEKTVKDMALSLNPGLIAVACGSYRRGKATCGDVDVLITHPDGISHKGIFSRVLHGLRQNGFLTDDLVSHEEKGNQKKYLGVCRLPGPERKHRRLDIIVVPYSEFACALMYFTGSAHFNRSMRALAKTKGMSLSEHSLNNNVVRKGNLKISTGFPLPTLTEKDIFDHLELPYREPHERDW